MPRSQVGHSLGILVALATSSEHRSDEQPRYDTGGYCCSHRWSCPLALSLSRKRVSTKSSGRAVRARSSPLSTSWSRTVCTPRRVGYGGREYHWLYCS